jgi:hypothetical protein
LPTHCIAPVESGVAEFDPSVVLTVHLNDVDLNGSVLQESRLDTVLGDVYRTRITKLLFIAAGDQVSYARLITILDSVYNRADRVVLLSKNSLTELLLHARKLDCYY